MSITVKDQVFLIENGDDLEIPEWSTVGNDVYRLAYETLHRVCNEGSSFHDLEEGLTLRGVMEEFMFYDLPEFLTEVTIEHIDIHGLEASGMIDDLVDIVEEYYDDIYADRDIGDTINVTPRDIKALSREQLILASRFMSERDVLDDYSYSYEISSLFTKMAAKYNITLYNEDEDVWIMNPQIPVFRMPTSDFFETITDNSGRAYFTEMATRSFSEKTLRSTGLSADDFNVFESVIDDVMFAVGKGSLNQTIIRIQ